MTSHAKRAYRNGYTRVGGTNGKARRLEMDGGESLFFVIDQQIQRFKISVQNTN
jgi:hypothetical protein